MTNSVQAPQKKSIVSGVIVASITGIAIVGLSILFYVAYQHGNGTAYSTGYEMGGMMAKILANGTIKNGIGLGSLLAVLTSWERNKSILWAIIHAAFGWGYVIYSALTRKKKTS